MGKPKNKGKSRNQDEDSDTEEMDAQNNTDTPVEKPAGKQSKKEKRKKKDDDWEADVASELASMSIDQGLKQDSPQEEEAPTINKKEKKKKKKQQKEEEEEEEEAAPVQKSTKKTAAFNMLMMDDDDGNVKSESDSEEPKPDDAPEPAAASKQQKKKDKKKGKKDKGKTAEEEDLDALLAELDKPKEKGGKKKKGKKTEEVKEEEEEGAEPAPAVEKVEPKVVTMEDLEDEEDDRKKKRKKKGKEKEKDQEVGEEGDGGEKAEEGGSEAAAAGADKGEEEEEGGTVKTAAQKRKEKKEREKKKVAEKKKLAAQKKEGKTGADKDGESEGKTDEAAGKEGSAERQGSDDEGEDEEKKKKKDKKKKGEKEEKVKKPSARVKMMQEMLKKQKEEEERLQKEEEERIRREEEAFAAAVKKKEEEELKKAQKKERQREKREQLKKEGLLLTNAQKQERKRADQILADMKARGIELPDKDEIKKKKPVYEHKKKKQQQKKEDTPEETPSPPETTPVTTPVVEEKAGAGEEKLAEAAEAAKVEEVAEDIKDEWDASSEEEDEDDEKESSPEAETKIEIVDKQTSVEAKEEEEDEEESEEEEESEAEDEDESESDSDSDLDDMTPYERAEYKIKKNHDKCEAARTTDRLRAPVVCVLGHVDTGKTKILDKLRRTNVQDGEAGGITQQIGATNVPAHAILEKTTMCKEFHKKEMKLPGLLIIDTPGHESFSNLRSRGSSLCDIAILVIDIMHGLEPQTIESINLLKERKTPFVVALNKIDRLYQWKTNPNSDVMNTIKKQSPACKQEFEERKNLVITELAEQSLNGALFYENKNPKEYVSLIPTSAHSGDGMGNLLTLICELTQTWLAKKISFTEELHATVMEVKALPGLGTTIDVILVNGKLCEGDQIVLAGTEGPIVTQIRGLLMPQPMRELRVKSQYEHHKEVPAAQGVKIIGKDLEKALAGLPLYVAHDEDEVEYYKEELSEALKDVLGAIKLTERGVFVQASTLGSLEALLEFLRTSKIPYAGINIGPVHKRDIMKASIMLEHDTQYAVILAFDVKVEREAQEMADGLGVNIFTADIIYHLQDKFLKFRDDLKKAKKDEFAHVAVFPCKLRVLPQHIFNKRDPIVMGVVVEAGIVRLGTPICVPSQGFVELGRITSIEVNHKPQEKAGRGTEVCIKIENIPGETPKLFGRHFDHNDMLMSKISRNSIDAVKDYFRDEMTKQDWTLMVELKKLFQIL